MTLRSPKIQSQLATELEAPKIWVQKWVDYSSKYGLGYLLNDSTVGVVFNDSSKIIIQTSKIQYIERGALDKTDQIQTFAASQYPKELAKKVTLLNHFKGYLLED